MPASNEVKSLNSGAVLEHLGIAVGLTALAALSSPVSQLTLSPVFGAVPASINHNAAIIITFIFGFMLHSLMPEHRSRSRVQSWLPVLAAAVPAVEYFAILQSEPLGIVGGPILAGLTSCHSIIIPAAYAIAAILHDTGIGNINPNVPSYVVNTSIALIPFIILERLFAAQLLEVITLSHWLTPAEVQLAVAAAFVLLCTPGPIAVVIAWITIILTYIFNPHGNGPYAQSNFHSSLEAHEWSLLSRQWSTTGYVSVLESRREDYRVLRCDHSLLGGEWLLDDNRKAQGWTMNEPVYSVFTMLEAVRLLETNTEIPDSDKKALVIGLGIGTAPKALISHGIDTTIVELDPAVYNYAMEYFKLPANHTVILDDAVVWVRDLLTKNDYERPHFDYIIHDVFTGGVEPLSLFTTTFLHSMRALLKEEGVVAINYAGDLTMPLTLKILNTIDIAFDRQCQVYSDDAIGENGSIESFSNFVVFCRNSPGEVRFRAATEADYIGSLNRRNHLVPKPAQRIGKTWAKNNEVLEPKDIKRWRGAQQVSAQKHWAVMRTVIPAGVWEMY